MRRGRTKPARNRRARSNLRGARFVSLQGANHLILVHEPAFARCLHEIEAFLAN
jgi:hypothetical protein